MNCDHLVGLYAGGPGSDLELLPLSQLVRTADFELESNARWLARGTGAPSAVARVKALDTRAKALGDRLESFGWCPRCGAKLESIAFLLASVQAPIPVDYGVDP